MVFGTPRRPTNGLQNECYFGKFPKIFTKIFFFVEMLVMDGCSKNSNNLSYKTPMDQQWQQCGTKVKINDRYSPKQDWVRQKTSK